MEFLMMAQPQGDLYSKWDTVAVRPDGFEWGAREYDSPNFRIVRVVDIDAPEGSTWIVSQPGYRDKDLPNGNKNLNYRWKVFDDAMLPAGVRVQLNKARTPNQKNIDVTIAAASFRDASAMRPIIPKDA